MLGAEKGYELNPSRPQSRYVADTSRIHAGLVRHQPDAMVADQVHAVGQQDRDPGAHPSDGGALRRSRGRRPAGGAAHTPTNQSR